MIPMSIFSSISFERSLSSATSYAARSLVPGINRSISANDNPPAGTGLDFKTPKTIIDYNTATSAPELYYHRKAREEREKLGQEKLSRNVRSGRESGFPLVYKNFPLSISGMDVGSKQVGGSFDRARTELHNPIYEYGYPRLEREKKEVRGFQSLHPPLVPVSTIPFSRDSLAFFRFKLANRTKYIQTWFSSNPTIRIKRKKVKPLTPGGWRWKEAQAARCTSSYSKRLLEKMSSGWEKIDDDCGEDGLETGAVEGLSEQRNMPVDGVFEFESIQSSGSTEEQRRASSISVWGFETTLAGLATGPVIRNGKSEMGFIGQGTVGMNSQSVSSQNLSDKALAYNPTPLTGPPKRKRAPMKIDWSTPNWQSSNEDNRLYDVNPGKRWLSEDFPPLSPQISPRTLPSSPAETLYPSTTLWQPTLQVDLIAPMPINTVPHPLPRTPSPRPEATTGRFKLMRRYKNETSGGKFNSQLWRRRIPQRNLSMDFACQGSIGRTSVFSEHIDPGFKRTSSDKAPGWSTRITIQKTKEAVGRVLGSVSPWRERSQNDNEEDRTWKDDLSLGRVGYWKAAQVRYPNNYYPSPLSSPPHPGNKVYFSESNDMVAMRFGLHETKEVSRRIAEKDAAIVEEKLKKQRRRGKLQKLMKRDQER